MRALHLTVLPKFNINRIIIVLLILSISPCAPEMFMIGYWTPRKGPVIWTLQDKGRGGIGKIGDVWETWKENIYGPLENSLNFKRNDCSGHNQFSFGQVKGCVTFPSFTKMAISLPLTYFSANTITKKLYKFYKLNLFS